MFLGHEKFGEHETKQKSRGEINKESFLRAGKFVRQCFLYFSFRNNLGSVLLKIKT